MFDFRFRSEAVPVGDSFDVFGKSPDGLPLRTGSPDPLLRPEEILSLPVEVDYSCEEFDLSDEKQRGKFIELMRRACRSEIHVMLRKDHWIEGRAAPVVWLEWAEMFRVHRGQEGG